MYIKVKNPQHTHNHIGRLLNILPSMECIVPIASLSTILLSLLMSQENLSHLVIELLEKVFLGLTYAIN